MKRFSLFICMLAVAGTAFASALGTAPRSVIPSEVQQIISVDYRTLKNSPTAMALKDRVLPDNLKEFETSLRGVGIEPSRDVDQLTFASFRSKTGLNVVGIAQGNFPTQKILKRMALKKIKPAAYRDARIYPMSGGTDMVFLDYNTMLFGARGALKAALDARDGEAPSLMSNRYLQDMIGAVENGAVWSVLDQAGTQNMMHSALGEAAQLTDYNVVRKRLLGSRYTMDFQNGLAFDLDVITSDTMTAATLSTLVKAGVMYRKMTATPIEKTALESVSVDSESANLRLHFRSDDKKFQSLLQSDLFTAVSR